MLLHVAVYKNLPKIRHKNHRDQTMPASYAMCINPWSSNAKVHSLLIMEFLIWLILPCLLFLAEVHAIDRSAEPFSPTYQIDQFNRSSFPTGFLFGASSSAYQVHYTPNFFALLLNYSFLWLDHSSSLVWYFFPLYWIIFSNRLKVHGMLMAKDLVYGIPSHINIQVYINLFVLGVKMFTVIIQLNLSQNEIRVLTYPEMVSLFWKMERNTHLGMWIFCFLFFLQEWYLRHFHSFPQFAMA